MSPTARSVVGVLVGFLVMRFFVIATTMAFMGLAHTSSGAISTPYLVIHCFDATIFAAAGGWIAAYIAGYKPLAHGIALGAITLALSALQFVHPHGLPVWYLVVLAVGPAVAAVAGASLLRQP